MSLTFYDVLGVDRTASTEAIEDAYRERASELHPDVSDDPNATEKFAALTRAEEVLTDDFERARYDQLGHETYTARHGEPEGLDPKLWEIEPSDEQSRSTAADPNAQPRGAASVSAARASDAGSTSSEQDVDPEMAERARRAAEWANAEDVGSAAETTRQSEANSEPDDGETEPSPTERRFGRSLQHRRESLSLAVAMFAVYPTLLAASTTSALSMPVNAVVGVSTLAVALYLLTAPTAAMLVFGAWSVLGPLGLRFVGIPLLSLPGLVVVGACWIPFCLSAVFRLALR